MSNKLPYGPVNVALFQEVKRKILEEPLRFDMSEWGQKIPAGLYWTYKVNSGYIQDRPPCGTVACIAGWASAIHHLEQGGALQDWPCRQAKIMDEARRLLEIPEEFQLRVFHTRSWPHEFRERYEAATTKVEQAKVAADYIDWICGLYQGEV